MKIRIKHLLESCFDHLVIEFVSKNGARMQWALSGLHDRQFTFQLLNMLPKEGVKVVSRRAELIGIMGGGHLVHGNSRMLLYQVDWLLKQLYSVAWLFFDPVAWNFENQDHVKHTIKTIDLIERDGKLTWKCKE